MTTPNYRSQKSVLELLHERGERLGVPLSAMFEIADRCNEVCVHCYQVQGQKGELETAQVFEVLEELASIGVLILTLSGGEATLRSDFLEIVRRARELGFAVKLYTNGLTMNETLADELARLAVLEVQISLYSHLAETQDWVTRVPGSFEKTTNAIRLLRARGIAVVMKTPMMNFNASAEAREAYIALATELDANWSFDHEIVGREDDDRSPEAFRISEALKRELLLDARLGSDTPGLAKRRGDDDALCGACSSTIHVEPNGEVRPCTSFTVPLGNAIVEGVGASHLRGELARDIRSLSWGTTFGCASCEINGHCHRCHASARLEAGDARAPYESACRSARIAYGVAIGTEVLVEGADALAPESSAVGPFTIVSPGVLRITPYLQTSEDHARLSRMPFLAKAKVETPTVAKPGELVQIRRPGKKARLERVPSEPEVS